MGWRTHKFWELLWQVVALLICVAAVGMEIMGSSMYLPRRLREGALACCD